jgi:hypothetical protein
MKSSIRVHLHLTAALAAAIISAPAAVRAQPAAYGQFVSDNSASPLAPVTPLPPVVAPQWSAAPPAGSTPVEQDPRRVPAQLASFPRDVTEPLLDQPDNFVLLPEIQQVKTPPRRDGFFQRISATTTYLPRFGDDSAGFEDTEVYGVFALPCPTTDCPMLIEPGTDFWVVDAPHFDLPATLHDDYLEFHWLGKLSERFTADLMVTPGWHSDYHNPNGSQAFRVEAHGVGVWAWSPQLKIALGVAYWDRINVRLIPAGGIIWAPNDDCRFELITPKPRITYRIDCGECFERWAYIAGEFGGGEWAIEQRGGVENILDYSDYRVMIGIEHKSLNLSLNGFAEIGYVFGRQVQYQKNLPDQNLPSTMMARIGLSY